MYVVPFVRVSVCHQTRDEYDSITKIFSYSLDASLCTKVAAVMKEARITDATVRFLVVLNGKGAAPTLKRKLAAVKTEMLGFSIAMGDFAPVLAELVEKAVSMKV